MGFKERIHGFPDVFDMVNIHIQKNFTILLEALGRINGRHIVTEHMKN